MGSLSYSCISAFMHLHFVFHNLSIEKVDKHGVNQFQSICIIGCDELTFMLLLKHHILHHVNLSISIIGILFMTNNCYGADILHSTLDMHDISCA